MLVGHWLTGFRPFAQWQAAHPSTSPVALVLGFLASVGVAAWWQGREYERTADRGNPRADKMAWAVATPLMAIAVFTWGWATAWATLGLLGMIAGLALRLMGR